MMSARSLLDLLVKRSLDRDKTLHEAEAAVVFAADDWRLSDG